MGLIDSLPNSSLGLKGKTPATRPGALKSSKIHNPDSFEPSKLDLDGLTPNEYIANLPK